MLSEECDWIYDLQLRTALPQFFTDDRVIRRE
jgi:hypothetical protein